MLFRLTASPAIMFLVVVLCDVRVEAGPGKWGIDEGPPKWGDGQGKGGASAGKGVGKNREEGSVKKGHGGGKKHPHHQHHRPSKRHVHNKKCRACAALSLSYCAQDKFCGSDSLMCLGTACGNKSASVTNSNRSGDAAVECISNTNRTGCDASAKSSTLSPDHTNSELCAKAPTTGPPTQCKVVVDKFLVPRKHTDKHTLIDFALLSALFCCALCVAVAIGVFCFSRNMRHTNTIVVIQQPGQQVIPLPAPLQATIPVYDATGVVPNAAAPTDSTKAQQLPVLNPLNAPHLSPTVQQPQHLLQPLPVPDAVLAFTSTDVIKHR